MRIELMIALNSSPIYKYLPVPWQTRYSRRYFFRAPRPHLRYTSWHFLYLHRYGAARHSTSVLKNSRRRVDCRLARLNKAHLSRYKAQPVRACTCRATALSEYSPIKSPTSSYRWDTADRQPDMQPARGRAC